MNHPRAPRGSAAAAVGLLVLVVAAAAPALAQNPLDPAHSWVEKNCDYVILTAPGGTDADLGDDGIVVHCRDAGGAPLAGLDVVVTIVELDGAGVWPAAAAATNADGRTLLTGYPGDSQTLVHGVVGVVVDVGGEEVLLDNGGDGFLLELRSPDLNGDLQVNLADFALFAASYGCCEDTEECLRADFDGDGCVGLADFAIFERYYLQSAREGGGARQNRSLFSGCIQHDFDTDGSPETIEEEIVALPSVPFALRFVARDFRFLSGVDFELSVPDDLVLLSRSPMPAFPLEVPGSAAPGNERVIVSGDCATEGPLFVYDFLFVTFTGASYTVDDFPLAHARFADCQYEPEVTDACIGSPTPCEVSFVKPDLHAFISCPGDDLDTVDTLTVVMNDQDGQGVPGLPADGFRVLLDDALGSDLANTMRFTPLAAETDADGELPFLMESRESCRWDVCLDLVITVRYESCDLLASQRIRTVNVVPAVSEGLQADAVVDAEDIAWWAAHEYTLDDCLALTQPYRCPVVGPADLALVQAHLGHACEFTAIPSSPRAVALHQNRPNPFNPRTEIRVDLPRATEFATVRVYDVRGRLVVELHGGPLPAGPSDLVWDGRDAAGRAVASGTYLARLRALGAEAAVGMLLLR